MFKYFIGKVTLIENDYIVLECNNIGYVIYVSDVSCFELNQSQKIYVYNQIREDANLLFGFKTVEELNFYEKLITVKGIGPKIALNVMKGDLNNVILAITNSDVKFLTSFSGIGPKAAKQIILDLNNKLEMQINSEVKTKIVSEYNNALEALLTIGVTKQEIKKHDQIIKTLETEAEIVKYVLANKGK